MTQEFFSWRSKE